MRRFVCTFVLLTSLIHASAAAEPTPKTSLLVLSKQDRTLAIVDPSDLHVVARIPVGDDPHEVVASADGKTAYVSNYGFGAFHTLCVVDLINQKRVRFIDLGALHGPHGLQFALGKVFFTAEAAKAIGSYDPATATIDWIMGTGQDRTHMLFVFPDGKRIATTNVNSATVTLMEQVPARPMGPPPGMIPPSGSNAFGGPPQAPPPGMAMGPPPPPPGPNWELTVIPVGRGSEGFDISPDLKEDWVANAQDGTISIIDLASKKVTATLDIHARGANRLKFTPDGKLALISAGPEVLVVDTATRRVVKDLKTGGNGGGIQMQPDGARGYESTGGAGYVAVIDLKTLEIVGKIDAGGGPDGLAWAVQP
jgi:DNA-binding beta-propeller fold protein YncE